jgi:hypothetical protein
MTRSSFLFILPVLAISIQWLLFAFDGLSLKGAVILSVIEVAVIILRATLKSPEYALTSEPVNEEDDEEDE